MSSVRFNFVQQTASDHHSSMCISVLLTRCGAMCSDEEDSAESTTDEDNVEDNTCQDPNDERYNQPSIILLLWDVWSIIRVFLLIREVEAIKWQTRATCVPKLVTAGLGLLYAGFVCDDSAAEAAVVTLYKWTLPFTFTIYRVRRRSILSDFAVFFPQSLYSNYCSVWWFHMQAVNTNGKETAAFRR